LGLHWQGGDPLAEFFPLVARENHQATVRVFGDGELACGGGAQHVTIPGRHRQPTFSIENNGRRTLEHLLSPLKHFSPQNCTFHHFIRNLTRSKWHLRIIFNEINDLEQFQQVTRR
jgi:hypothetical protein